LRAGMPGDFGATAVNTRVLSRTPFRTRGCGCIVHPAFPTPFYGRELMQRLGRIAPRGVTRVGATICPVSRTRYSVLSAMPTGRANARPMTGSASSGHAAPQSRDLWPPAVVDAKGICHRDKTRSRGVWVPAQGRDDTEYGTSTHTPIRPTPLIFRMPCRY
jgi:hypothetical protein